MSRLTRSLPAYLRLMQMSSTRVFVFVEGYSDRTVYDELCTSEYVGTNVSYSVRTAEELHAGAGGKAPLLAFLDVLRRRKALTGVFKGKHTGVLFFLDKDIDDVRRVRRRSPHVVYTEHYDFESYLFIHGDLVRAAATASGLDMASLHNVLMPSAAWRERAAREWIEWLELCICAHLLRARCKVTYSRPSPFNKPNWGGVDEAIYAQTVQVLANACGGGSLQLSETRRRVSRLIHRSFRAGAHDRLFKGKWYRYFAASEARVAAGRRGINSRGLEDRVTDILKATLDLTGTWTTRYRLALRMVVS